MLSCVVQLVSLTRSFVTLVIVVTLLRDCINLTVLRTEIYGLRLLSSSPSLKPCEPVDTTCTRYLNQSHTPLTNLSNKDLHIELHNKKYVNKPLQISIIPFTYQHVTLKLSNESLPSFSSVIELHKKTNTCLPQPLFEKVDAIFSNPLSLLALHKPLATTDCLFFIQYIPEDTIKSRWFFVQVNCHGTKIFRMDLLRTGDYYITLLSRHPADRHLYDDVVRWWHK